MEQETLATDQPRERKIVKHAVTLLKAACTAGDLAAVQGAVLAGAPPEKGLANAARHDQADCLTFLLTQASRERQEAVANDVIQAAVGGNAVATLTILLDAKFSETDSLNEQFRLAVRQRAWKTADLLLARGANCDAENGYALGFAATIGNQASVAWLLERGANPLNANARDLAKAAGFENVVALLDAAALGQRNNLDDGATLRERISP